MSESGRSDEAINYKEAAATAIAQAIANAAQDQVDLMRNQAIIKTTAMGNAYAKWLANPVMGVEYKEILDNTVLDLNHLPLNQIDSLNQACKHGGNDDKKTVPPNRKKKS